MTVKELMERLAQFDENMVVMTDQNDGPEIVEYIEVYNNTIIIG